MISLWNIGELLYVDAMVFMWWVLKGCLDWIEVF